MPRLRAACLVVVALAACHGHGSSSLPTGGHGAYPASQWIPADATYAVTGRSARETALVLRDLVAVVGIVADFDEREASRGSTSELGVDLLDPTSYGAVGIDPAGGVALFSEGLSPTLAIALTDPATTTAAIDRMRQGGVAVQVAREQGIEVYTFAGDREVHIHWAIADHWLFVHVEITAEHEADLAWFRAVRAAHGAWSGGADLAAAVASARLGTAADGPAVIGAVHVPALIARALRLGAPHGCIDQIAGVERIFVAARSDARDARGSIAVEIAGGVPADATFAAPAGWAQAREGAPVQAELGIDLDRLVPRVSACERGLGRDLAELGVKAGRGYVHSIDIDDLSGRGAAWVATRNPRMISDLLDEIPARSLAEHKRAVHGVQVVDVSVPMLPKFSYVLGQGTFLGAASAGEIDRVIGDGTTAPAALARLVIAPQAWPADTWDELLKVAGFGRDGARGRMITRLRHWALGELELTSTATGVILTAHGTRATIGDPSK